MSKSMDAYTTSTGPVVNIEYVDFSVTPAERNLLLRLRQVRGLVLVDSESMCLWVAGRMEQCNGKRARLPFEM